MERKSNIPSPPMSSHPGRGRHPLHLEGVQRAQIEAMGDRTARRVGELMEQPPAKNRDLQKDRASSSASRKGAGSPILEYVKRTQTEAMEMRTAHRIMEIDTGSSKFQVDGDFAPIEFDDAEDVALIDDKIHRSPPSYQEASSALKTDEFTRVPESALRRNITQRRSRSKSKDEGMLAPEASMMSRRPRTRSKDRRYSMESTGIRNPKQDSRPATAVVPPKSGALSTRIPALSHPESDHHDDEMSQGAEDQEYLQRSRPKGPLPSAHSHHDKPLFEESMEYAGDMNTVFMKHSIPDEEDHPTLRAQLLLLWEQRQATAVAMNVALFEDEVDEYAHHQEMFYRINRNMHITLKNGSRGHGSPELDTSRTQASSSVSTPQLLPHGGHAPDPDYLSSSSKSPRWRNIDSLPLVGPLSRNGEKGHVLKRSFKDDQQVFEIFFSYQNMEVARTVNDNLPLRVLFAMAQSYLEHDFHFRLRGDQDFDLIFEERSLPRFGVLSDIPIIRDSVILVLYPLRQLLAGERRSGTSSSPSSPHLDGRQRILPPQEDSDLQHRESIGIRAPIKDGLDLYDKSPSSSLDPKSYDKIRQSFKCPKFSGQARDWKMWDKGFWRYLSIWELEYVLDPSFFDVLPLNTEKRRDNKLVYFIIEDSVQNSSLAMSYVRKAALHNGFEAYYTLHDGYVFAGATTATLLLNELSNFRFLPDESPTELCLRLDELFQELRDLPGDAAVTFIDTQKVGYLVNALRHEKEWDYVCSAITSAQIKGGYSFHDACEELKIRCEASRVNDMLDRPVKGKRVKGLVSKGAAGATEDSVDSDLSTQVRNLISTFSKKHNSKSEKESTDTASDKKTRRKRTTFPCLAAGCEEHTSFPMCPLHYHSLLSGKSASVKLHSGYGDATYDAESQLVIYPAKVPDNRLTAKQIAARTPSQRVAAKLSKTDTSS